MTRGLCCQAFPLSHPYADIIASYDAWRAFEKEYIDIDGNVRQIPEDTHLIATMIRQLGVFSEHPLRSRNYDEPRLLHSCIHLEDGCCSIYERRPRMCKSYGATWGSCEYPSCPLYVSGRCASMVEHDLSMEA